MNKRGIKEEKGVKDCIWSDVFAGKEEKESAATVPRGSWVRVGTKRVGAGARLWDESGAGRGGSGLWVGRRQNGDFLEEFSRVEVGAEPGAGRVALAWAPTGGLLLIGLPDFAGLRFLLFSFCFNQIN